MTNSQSAELDNGFYDDKAVLRALKNYENAFSTGDREALFRAIVTCARFQAVIPDWAADAILAGDAALKSGEITDFNQMLSSGLASKQKRQREARIKANTNNVLSMLMKYRCDGGSLNTELAFGEISDSTGISRREVEEIYRRNAWVKDIPQGNPGGGSYGFSNCEIPLPRRRGRPIL